MEQENKKVCIKCGKEKEEHEFYKTRNVCVKCYNLKRNSKILKHGWSSKTEGYVFINIKLPIMIRNNYTHLPENESTITDERILKIEDEYCSVNGCGRILGLREKLFGGKCINHSKVENLCVEYR